MTGRKLTFHVYFCIDIDHGFIVRKITFTFNCLMIVIRISLYIIRILAQGLINGRSFTQTSQTHARNQAKESTK